jgi:hypothetical protein
MHLPSTVLSIFSVTLDPADRFHIWYCKTGATLQAPESRQISLSYEYLQRARMLRPQKLLNVQHGNADKEEFS